jgi:hypothetical protein
MQQHVTQEQLMGNSMRSSIAVFLTLTFSVAWFLSPVAESQTASAPSASKSAAAFPSCTDSLSTVAVPGGPHGLFAILFPNAQMNEKAERVLLHNPLVCGVNLYLVWNEIDRGPNANPRYDFSRVEEQMRPWVKAGKEVNFISWATGYGKGGHARVTPDYVFRQVQSVSCPNAGEVPVFWEKGFMQNYQAFMSAIVQHFGDNPAVGYIRFGLGLGGETYPACMYALKNKGFSPQRWTHYIFDMLDYEASLNSPKQLMVGINSFGNPPNIEFADAVARRAVRDNIAIGSQGLSMDDARRDQSGSPCEVDWCRMFREAAGKVPLELQTVKQSDPELDGRVGSMVDLLPFAKKLNVQIFEIYLQDWLIAYDPGNPDYDRHHKEYQQTFEAAARVVGAH